MEKGKGWGVKTKEKRGGKVLMRRGLGGGGWMDELMVWFGLGLNKKWVGGESEEGKRKRIGRKKEEKKGEGEGERRKIEMGGIYTRDYLSSQTHESRRKMYSYI